MARSRALSCGTPATWAIWPTISRPCWLKARSKAMSVRHSWLANWAASPSAPITWSCLARRPFSTAQTSTSSTSSIVTTLLPEIVRQGEYVSSEIENRLQERGITLDGISAAMQQFSVETPSWGYGDSGTRFKVFHWPGAASTLREKLADAAEVQRVTGICPGVAIHIPWDWEDDWQAVKDYARQLGLRIGAVNPNIFQEDT